VKDSEEKRYSFYLPTLSTIQALAEGRHRLISAASLGLVIADHPLFTAAAFKAIADALLDHGDLGLLHVLQLQHGVRLALLGRQELLGRHDDELRGGDDAGHDVAAEVCVALHFQVLKEGPDLFLIGLSLTLVGLECCCLDRDGLDEHGVLRFGGSVGQAVVENADAVVAQLRVGAVDIDLVGLELASLGVPFVHLLAAANGDDRTGSRGGSLASRRGRVTGSSIGSLQTLSLLFLLDALSPFSDDVVGSFTDVLVRVASEFADYKTSFRGLRISSGQLF
jgi:hypothetical protein